MEAKYQPIPAPPMLRGRTGLGSQGTKGEHQLCPLSTCVITVKALGSFTCKTMRLEDAISNRLVSAFHFCKKHKETIYLVAGEHKGLGIRESFPEKLTPEC